MDRVPYSGTELKTNGYYYSNLRSNGRNISVAIFYRNGFCIHSIMDVTYSNFEVKSKQDTLEYIKRTLFEDKSVIQRFLNEPTSIGVFRIEGKDIEFETWENGYDVLTFSNYGKILNDSTFLINKFVSNQSRKEWAVNLTYKFVEYSPKPDSISSFIK